MTEHEGLPVEGYKPQPQVAIDLVNENKRLEEECLRVLDSMAGSGAIDQRMLAIGKTQLQGAWMWINRAVFQPGRVKLPGDP